MATFPDLRSYQRDVGGDPLTLPVGGREYTFTEHLPIDTGLIIARLREETSRFTRQVLAGQAPDIPEDTKLLDDKREVDLYLELIGPDNVAQMKADKVDWAEIQHVGFTVFTWHLAGPQQALVVWSHGEEAGLVPPRPGSSSTPPKTSPPSSTTSKPANSKPRSGRGQTSSKPGRSSKPTSRSTSA